MNKILELILKAIHLAIFMHMPGPLLWVKVFRIIQKFRILFSFVLILYIPVTNFSSCRDRFSWVESIPSHR